MRFYFLLSVLVFSLCTAKSQTAEKIYIHFDKDIYLPGETLWFKAYLFRDNQLSQLSTNFYTAIYDAEGKILQQKKYPIFNGVTNGEFVLSDTIETNKLQFIAFTALMWQTDSTKIFKKNIDVFQNDKTDLVYSTSSNKNISLQWFVEGGNALEGFPNYFVFKASYSDGEPAQIKGSILDQASNAEIDSFYTNESGMGKIQFIPQPNSFYISSWVDENGETKKTALPQINRTGANLHIEQTENYLHYVINKSKLEAKLNTLTLTAKMNGEEVYHASLKAENALKIVNKIPLDSFANGLMELQLMDANNLLLQKRMVYINNESKNPIILITQKSAEPKGQNSIEIQIPDSLKYNLSVSIFDANFNNKQTGKGIHEGLWLNNNSFQNNEKIDLDFLMLTQEWAPIKLQEVLPNIADNYLNLIVGYKNKNFGLPKTENLTIIINDSIIGKQFYNLPRADLLSFNQQGLVFYDSAKVYYRLFVNKEDEKNLTFKLANKIKFPEVISALEKHVSNHTIKEENILSDDFALSNLKFFINPKSSTFNAVQTINEVRVKAKYINPETKRILEIDNKYTSGMFSGVARGFAINVLDDPKAASAIDIYSYIRRRLPMLEVKGVIGERVVLHPFRGTPILFIDETEREMNELESVSPRQVAYIKYVQGIIAGSSFTSSAGALYIYYRKGNEDIFSDIPKMHFVKLKGFDLPLEFTNPDYSDKEQLKKPDLRTSLYWNPNLTSSADNNKFEITYFNNDISKKLLLIIEGVSEDGNLIHVEKIIDVE